QTEHRDHAEREEGEGVNGPALLALGIDARDAVDHPLDRVEHAVAGRRAVIEHLRHVAAEQRGGDDDRDDDARDEEPVVGRHQSFSGKSSAITRYAPMSTEITRPT